MLSTIITVVSLGVMLLISASFITGTIRERKRYEQAARIKLPMSSSQFHSFPFQQLQTQNGMMLPIAEPVHQTSFSLPSSWYRRRRTLVSLGLLLMLMLTLFVQSGVADGVLQGLGNSFVLFSNSFNASNLSTAAHSNQMNASQQLLRFSQIDPTEYASLDEYNTWAYSACSAASMTEVFNAYGHHYRVTDILKVEAQIGEITPSMGLLRPEGIQNTAAQFGFKTTWGNAWTLDKVIEIANHGNPVIVSFPPDRYAGGHILVVTGGNSSMVFLADTSLWNRHSLSRGQFQQWWEGFAAVVTPR